MLNQKPFPRATGAMPKQTINTQRDSSDVMRRRIIRDAISAPMVQPKWNNLAMQASPSRAWSGTDDYLARRDYKCGGPNPSVPVGTAPYLSGMFRGAVQNCDSSGIPAANCNPKFVPDASTFGYYRAMRSITQTYDEA